MTEGKNELSFKKEIKDLKDRIESLEKDLSAVKEANTIKDETIRELKKSLEINNALIKKYLPHIEGLEKIKSDIIPVISEATGYAPKDIEDTLSMIGDKVAEFFKSG